MGANVFMVVGYLISKRKIEKRLYEWLYKESFDYVF